ncbi:SpvB/TcaC N-terminal domain-containing protein [Ascidiimonas sp. W6]|uniref:SpvB/TcaC N-terminal domain-containing protein n=1 Tax=Ascidiimonas meishanensis TaxID=3128903 RepID=UPI0030EE121D
MSQQNQNTPSSSEFFKTDRGKSESIAIEAPSINLPKGGGAIKGIDEKFSVNAVNGTSGFFIPLPFSNARGATPSLDVSYNSGSGNSIFGLGWNLNLTSIKRKTAKELPQYLDTIDSDTFIFSESEDLVPEFKKNLDGSFQTNLDGDFIIKEEDASDGLHIIRYYKPRIEGAFARMERWQEKLTGIFKWRIISNDNTTSLFGWSVNSRIANPGQPTQIFEWLPEFVFDDKGNCSRYFYKKENSDGFDTLLLHHKNRLKDGSLTYTNTYLEKICYGNKTPYKNFGDAFPLSTNFLFSTVFDYGEYDENSPFEKIKDWDFRPDAFSNYKPGFEIRTTRLCKRVLLFHHFTNANEYEGLVKSVNFSYDLGIEEDFTFLSSVTILGYIKRNDGSYSTKSLPSLEFTYQQHDWNTEIKQLNSEELENAPVGPFQTPYQFTDLFNEGLSGILTEQASGLYYKHNLGDGNFEPLKLISPKPSFSGVGNTLILSDLDADGTKQLINYQTSPKGYFELNDDEEWASLKNFKELPNIDFNDANTRMLDLNGDGKPDLLISENHVFRWYPSKGRAGFSPSKQTSKPFNEEEGPHLVFADTKESIFLADMSGDGMTDIVRIRNSEICYWPNLGYGHFGSKVALDNTPAFDHPDAFNPKYIKISDLDGSGTADIIYLGKNKFTCYKNLSGNRFSILPFEIDPFSEIHDRAAVTIADLLGTGLSCIVWSSPLPKDSITPVKYIDLMNSKKPHIMVSYKNNMGKEVSLEYTPSTKFYLQDKAAGKPWVTKLHFPVYCVSKSTIEDKIGGSKYVSEYSYHHGYFDHEEREFRGFGMVEQKDTETFEHWVKSGASNITEQTLHQEPVVTKTWFHTGAFLRNKKILAQFEDDYWYNEIARQGFLVSHPEVALPDARIIAAPEMNINTISNLSADELREAYRACKSMPLRSETFARDAIDFGSTEEARRRELTPYNVETSNCIIELLQPRGKNKYAVFIVKESEAISYTYERKPDDARISHSLNIKLDAYGNILESASVVYPRLIADAALPVETQLEQAKTKIIYTENRYTNAINTSAAYRLPMPSEVKTFELKGVAKGTSFYTPQDFEEILSDTSSDSAHYHELDKPLVIGKAQKRLLEHTRSLYYGNNLTAPLPLHQLESLAIPYESYQLAYTPELLTNIFGTLVTAPLLSEGKFIHSEGDNNWWVRSGTIQFIEGVETFTDAQNRFFTPVSHTDPFGAITRVTYYGTYFMMVDETEDALGNKTSVDSFNFRTLSAERMIDINGNISEGISDELGMLKAMAILGKGAEADELTGLTEITEVAERNAVLDFFNSGDSVQLTSRAKTLLQRASTRFVYDLEAYQNSGKPVVISSIKREQHFVDNPNSPVQIVFEYSNGLGEVIMKKVQATPGIAKQVTVNPNDTIVINSVDTSLFVPKQLRWMGSGRSVKNNKGNKVKQYEPYYSVTHQFEDYKELVENGVTSVLYYDAANRLTKTEMPDGTFSKVEFDSWKQLLYDANDTLLEAPWYTNRSNRLIDAELIADGKDPGREKLAADMAVKHANTPQALHFDTLGRAILMVQHNKDVNTLADVFTETKSELDTEGNLRSLTDARGNTVMSYKYNMLGTMVYQESMDTGQRWKLQNILGMPLRNWDERNHEFQHFYDILQRPLYAKIMGGDGTLPLDHIFEKTVYGESLLLPGRTNEVALQARNILGKPIQSYDTGGLVDMPDYNFKGKPIAVTRRLFKKYKEVANWIPANLVIDLETDIFTFTTETDALGRISQQIAPDGSIITPSYNESGVLTSESVLHPGAIQPVQYIKNIEYNEKGQRAHILYGNDVSTHFYYDKQTFRLTRIESKRQNNDPLQDWRYTFDGVGNVTHIEDRNIPQVFFNNQKVTGIATYTYDALYQLVEATGRENDSVASFDNKDKWRDDAFMHQMNPGDPMAVRNYTQTYVYDSVGNISSMQHASVGNNWTRTYNYQAVNNRLINTQAGAFTYNYQHHLQHGFITEMPHLEELAYNFKEELIKSIRQKRTDGGTPETTWYQYDGSGQRLRKITENQADPGLTPTKKEERIYISGYELYKKHSGTNAGLERETLSLIDQGKRFVMVETRNGIDDGSEVKLIRYQLHNHLGSAALELDENSEVISYEEYHPFGTTAYQAKNAAIKSVAKRYRFTGMERDEETGLEYHSARYYLPWLGRWLNTDPIGIADGVNLYAYAGNNPVMHSDTSGTQARPQMGFWELPVYQTNVTATYSSRGISQNLRYRMTGVYRIWTGDYTSKVDVGHMGKPFVLLRSGEVSPVGPQLASENRSDGGGTVRSLAATERAAGRYTRTGGNDMTPSGIASKGRRNPPNPLPPALRDSRLVRIGSAASPPQQTPAITLPASSTPSAPSNATASATPRQLSFDFSSRSSSASSTPATPRPPAPRPPAPTPSLTSRVGSAVRGAASSTASFVSRNRGAVASTGAAATARAVGGTLVRGLVPGAAEAAEAASVVRSVGGVGNAARLAVQPVVTAGRTVATAAASASGTVVAGAAVTVVAAGATGAIVGDVVEEHVTEATGSREVGVAAGTAAGAASGALVGAAIGSVVPGLGTAAGAVIGGAAGAIGGFITSYW